MIPRDYTSFREREVLALIALGCTRAQAGKRLYLSPDTIKTHLRRASEVYGIPAIGSALVIEAVRRGDIEIAGYGDVRPVPEGQHATTFNGHPLPPRPRRNGSFGTLRRERA